MLLLIIIPPVYEVYRGGYIVFVFSITMCVCVCVCKLFFVKDFTGTTEPRILKFGTNIGYNLLYCVRENQPDLLLIIPFIYPFFFLSNKNFCQISRLLCEPKSSNFVYTLRVAKFNCGKEIQDAEIIFCLLFPFFLFSISHSNVIHRELCVKDFSGTTAPRILKFGTNIGYDLLLCVRENQPPDSYCSFICPFFFLSNQIFCYRFLGFYESQSLLKFCIHLESGQVYCGTENQDAEIFFFHLFSIFPFFHLSLQCNTYREICVKDFSETTAPRILKFGTNFGYDLLYCVKENQHAVTYRSPCLSIFLSRQANFLLQIS